MTDGAVPPLPPASAPTQVQTQTPAPAQQPAPSPATVPVVTRAPVEQAPPELTLPKAPVRIEGRVTATTTGTVRVTTAEGEITIRTQTPVPPDTEVTVDLYTEKNATLANLIVLRRQTAMTEELAQAVIPPKAAPPALKPGDVVTALQLPEDTPPVITPPKAALPEKIVQTVLDMKPADLKQIIAQLNIPKATVDAFLKAPDPLAAFKALPTPLQEKITALVTPQLAADAPKMPAAAPPALPALPDIAADVPDTNLLQIMRAQLAAKVTQQVIQTPAAPATPAQPQTPALSQTAPQPFSILGALLPVIEHMTPQGAGDMPFLQNLIAAKAQQIAGPGPQNMHEFKIIQVMTPEQAAKTPPAPQPQTPQQPVQLIRGEVESLTPSGHPVIKTDNAHFVLRTPVAIATGSVILFESTPVKVAGLTALPAAAGVDPFSGEWPALEEALQSVPLPVLDALHRSLPAPSKGMTPAAMLFLAALRGGDVESWLGATTMQVLRKDGRRGLAERLTGDFGKLAEQAKETLPGGWRMISMPLLNDEALSQIHFFMRRQNQEQDKSQGGSDDGKPATRFLLNLSLSRMGDMQLDGFLHRKQLDLVLRTQNALPMNMRQDIMQRFAAGLEQTGMQGGMSFQAKKQGWVTVEMPPQKGTIA